MQDERAKKVFERAGMPSFLPFPGSGNGPRKCMFSIVDFQIQPPKTPIFGLDRPEAAVATFIALGH